MRRILVVFTILCYCIPLQAQEFDTKKMRYIERYKYWAMDEQIRTGVPAAISLAQGILETGSGTSELSNKANNHFGIKCKKEWTGETYLHDDDRRRECFRKYKSAKDSYVDHSNFLKGRAHYASLFTLDITDYQAWSTGLRKAGYATNPKYATRLIQLIEKYNLQEYTYEAIELSKEEVVAEVVPEKDVKVIKGNEKTIEETELVKVAPISTSRRSKKNIVYDKVIEKNGRNGFWAHKGDYLLPNAVRYNIRYAKLLAMNDLEDAPLSEDMFIYLRKKAKKGSRMFHKVKEGESMHGISQEVGVQLKYLFIYNNLFDSEEPAAGEKIYLQARSSKTPRLRGQVAKAAERVTVKKVESPVIAEKKIQKTIPVIKKQVEAKKVSIVKKVNEVEKIDFSEQQKEIPKIKKKDAVVGIKKIKRTEERIVQQKKVQPKIVEKIEDRIIPKKVEVIETKSGAQKASLITRQAVSSPVIDIVKAKKVERLMGDGSREVEKIFMENQKALKARYDLERQKVIPAPGTNNKDLKKIKAEKTIEKRKAGIDKNKNVTEDVKNLKKKFDSLIYEEDE